MAHDAILSYRPAPIEQTGLNRICRPVEELGCREIVRESLAAFGAEARM